MYIKNIEELKDILESVRTGENKNYNNQREILKDVLPELWEDDAFALETISVIGSYAFDYIMKTNDRDFMMKAIFQDSYCFAYIGESLCDDELFWYAFADKNLKRKIKSRIKLENMLVKTSDRLKNDKVFRDIMKIRCENNLPNIEDVKDICLVFANDERFSGMFDDIDASTPLLFEPIDHKYFRELISDVEVVFHTGENVHMLADTGKILFKKKVLDKKDVYEKINTAFNENLNPQLKPTPATYEEQELAEVENFIKMRQKTLV